MKFFKDKKIKIKIQEQNLIQILFHLQFILRFSFLCFLLSSVTAEKLNCHFSELSRTRFHPASCKCFVKNVEIFNGGQVTIEGIENLSECEFGEISEILIKFAPKLNQFPSGIDKLFPNLRFLQIYYSKLEKISSNELKSFPKLMHLDLEGNKISEIKTDIFSYNPDLEIIKLNYNRISKKIDSSTFAGLKNLTKVYLGGNKCHFPDGETQESFVKLFEFLEEPINSCDIDKEDKILLKQDEILREIKNIKNSLNPNNNNYYGR